MYGRGEKKEDVVILNKKSYFNNYVIENNMVRIRCVVTIENKSKQEKTESDSITIPPLSSLNYIDVEFTGGYGGVSKMKSRNLPKLHIIEVLKNVVK